MFRRLTILCLVAFTATMVACDKTSTGPDPDPNPNPNPNPNPLKLSYGDSVFFYTPQAEDHIILPTVARSGTYIGFPDGIEIDGLSGAINVSKSEAGLKYKVSFIPTGKTDTVVTYITIAGINYLDGFYNMSSADSIISPIYNASPGKAIPGINSGSLFDIGSGCNSQGCKVNVSDGSINLAETVRNGIFGNKPANDERKEFELVYSLNDNSKKATVSLKVKLYYYETVNDITPEAYAIIAERQGTLFLNGVNTPVATQAKVGKPRPPCIFIVGR